MKNSTKRMLRNTVAGGLAALTAFTSGCSGLAGKLGFESKQKSVPVEQAIAHYEMNKGDVGNMPEDALRERQYLSTTQPVTEEKGFLDKCVGKMQTLHPRIAVEYDHNQHKETIVTPQSMTIGEHEITWDKEETKKISTGTFTTTLGLGCGKEGSWNNEFFRMYHNIDHGFDAEGNPVTTEWTEPAIKGSFTLGSKEDWHVGNEGEFFGSTGDISGYGIQTKHDLWEEDRRFGVLTLNADKNESTDFCRLGAGLTIDLTRNVRVNTAYDVVNGPENTETFFQVGTDFDLGKKDRFGLVYELEDSETNGRTHTGVGVWTHTNDAWGTRVYGVYSYNPENDSTNLRGDFQVVQNPIFGHGSGNAVWSRNNGDLRARNTVTDALDVEVPVLGGKSGGGWVAEGRVDYSDLAGQRDWKVKGGAGYVFGLGNDTTLSVVPYGEVFTRGTENGHGYGIDVLLGRPDLFGELTLRRSEIGGQEDTGLYVYLGITFPPK